VGHGPAFLNLTTLNLTTGEIAMNLQDVKTLVPVPARAPAPQASVPRRAARLLVRGPARLKSPAARWAVNILALAGAVALVWSSVIHLQLWSDGYKAISVIGPLFLIQGIVGIALALVIVAFRWAVMLAAGAVLLAGTAVGLLLSAGIGLFGYQESLAVPYAASSLTVEFAGATVLAAAVTIVLAARLRPRLARSRA
jgi:hypothetical protein